MKRVGPSLLFRVLLHGVPVLKIAKNRICGGEGETASRDNDSSSRDFLFYDWRGARDCEGKERREEGGNTFYPIVQ